MKKKRGRLVGEKRGEGEDAGGEKERRSGRREAYFLEYVFVLPLLFAFLAAEAVRGAVYFYGDELVAKLLATIIAAEDALPVIPAHETLLNRINLIIKDFLLEGVLIIHVPGFFFYELVVKQEFFIIRHEPITSALGG